MSSFPTFEPVSDDRIRELAKLAAVRYATSKPSFVPLNACQYKSDDVRYKAAQASIAAAVEVGTVPMVMLDHQSISEAEQRFNDLGALVLPVEDGEGGVARPYNTAVRVIQRLIRDNILPAGVVVGKYEAEKTVLRSHTVLTEIMHTCLNHEVVTGVRSTADWGTMPDLQGLLECIINDLVYQMHGTTHDVTSGVIFLSRRGLDLMAQCRYAQWQYLIEVPLKAKLGLVPYGSVGINLVYPEAIKQAENGNPDQDNKRREQLKLMLAFAEELAVKLHQPVSPDIKRSVKLALASVGGVASIPLS